MAPNSLTSFHVLPSSIESSTTPPSMSVLRRFDRRNDQRCLTESENVVSAIVKLGDVRICSAGTGTSGTIHVPFPATVLRDHFSLNPELSTSVTFQAVLT